MINLEKIQYNEPIYYVPSYTGVCKVSILHKLSGDTPMMLVKPYSKKKDFKAFPTPLEFIFNSEEDAKHSGRDWEHYMRQRKKDEKKKKKEKSK